MLGPTPQHPSGTPIAKAYETVIDLMHKHGVKRLLLLGTASAVDPADTFSVKYWFMINGIWLFAGNAYKDIVAIGELIRSKGADLDYTFVRVPILSNKEVREVVAGYVGDGKTGTVLARAGLAAFYVKELQENAWVKKAPLITSP